MDTEPFFGCRLASIRMTSSFIAKLSLWEGISGYHSMMTMILSSTLRSFVWTLGGGMKYIQLLWNAMCRGTNSRKKEPPM
jgi:hypothetical protein